jgi:hypothetical protein
MSKKKRNTFIIGVIMCVLITFGYMELLYRNTQKTREYSSVEANPAVNAQYQVDELRKDTSNLYIRGWYLIEDEPSTNHTMYLFLKNKRGNKYIQLPTNITSRDDIAALYTEQAHKYSGFYAVCKLNKLDLNTDYSLILVYTDSRGSYETTLTDSLRVGSINE